MNTSEVNSNKNIAAADTAAESGASAVDNALLTRSANIVHATHNSSISNSTALHQVHFSPTDSTSIDMEYEPNIENRHDTVSTSSPSSSSSSVQRNFLTLFSGARNQLGRNTSLPLMHQQSNSTSSSPLYAHTDENEATRPFRYTPHENAQTQHTAAAASQSPTHARNIRSWRMNLNNVLSFSTAPSTEAIRSLITNSGSFRYAPLNTNDVSAPATATDNVHVLLQQQEQQQRTRPHTSEHSTYLGNNYAETSSRNSFNSSLRTEDGRDSMEYNRYGNHIIYAPVGGADTAVNVPQVDEAAVDANFAHRNGSNRNTTTQQDDDNNNVISDMFVKFLSHFVRYLPFLIILFVKFVHDHLLGILDLLLLHGIMYQVNKSLREQIAKFSQKSYGILLRDFGLVGFVVAYRFVLSSSAPDPFGLLIAPPTVGITLPLATESISSETKNKLSAVLSNYLGNINIMQNAKTDASTEAAAASLDSSTVNITKVISLGVLLYYVAVNDLILKLITILLKISITLMPTNIIRHKPRARMYVLVEYFSQFYRALAPVRQWLMFLFESYSGLEVISGILFSSFYMGAKGFEFVERGKSLRKALLNFIRNMDYERKPTKDELEAAGAVCPICHDAYSTPVVLECGHIFCDDCVSTWFKREQTCPMCRAKVSEDPTWQDGSTTFFYQLW